MAGCLHVARLHGHQPRRRPGRGRFVLFLRRPARPGAVRRGRWRGDRYVDRLSPRPARGDRRRPPRAQVAHVWHHLACSGRGGLGRSDGGCAVDGALLRRALCAPGGGDGALDGVPPLWLPPAGHHAALRRGPTPRDGVHALGGDDQGHPVSARGGRPGAADADRRRHPRLLDARRGAGQPRRRDHVAGQGRPAARGEDLRGHRGHRLRPRPRPGGRRPHGAWRRRVREGRDRRGAVGSRGGSQGRRHRAPPGRRALLPAHRADRRCHAGVGAGDRGDRGLRLLPRGGRWPPRRDVRAGRQGLGAGRHATGQRLRRAPARLGPAGAVPRGRDAAFPCPRGRRDPHPLLRTGELHRRPLADARASLPRSTASISPAASTPSASCPAAASAT